MTATPHHSTWDVAIIGLGPAGRALAHRTTALGLSVVSIDPLPHRTWTATYAAWFDELPEWLPPAAIATSIARPSVWTTRRQTIDRRYCVLNTQTLQSILSEGIGTVIAGKVIDFSPTRVRLDDNSVIESRVVVDARGTSDEANLAQQTAYGVVVDSAVAAPVLAGSEALFMDWRSDNGTAVSETPSFLYAVPLPSGKFLLEETCLVSRPTLEVSELACRLHRRLQHHGVSIPPEAEIEKVQFPVQPPPGTRRPHHGAGVRYGTRAGLMHPGTGYSVAASLMCADTLAYALRDGSPERLWPWRARTVASLRSVGLRVLLSLDSEQMPVFFEHFFELPAHLQAAYLSERTNPVGTASAMSRMFFSSPRHIRRAVMHSVLRREVSRTVA